MVIRYCDKCGEEIALGDYDYDTIQIRQQREDEVDTTTYEFCNKCIRFLNWLLKEFLNDKETKLAIEYPQKPIEYPGGLEHVE